MNTILQNKKKILILLFLIFTLLFFIIFYYVNFNSPQKSANIEQFNIPATLSDSNEVANLLLEKGYIKSKLGFRIAFFGFNGLMGTVCIDCISAGSYKISKTMNVFDVVKILKSKPYLVWVTIPEGLRKEEIADILADTLAWTTKEKEDWINIYTAEKDDYFEGVYFPDTYLIPTDEKPDETAKRMRAKFEEKFADYSKEAVKQNIKWTTVIKVASLIQREAAGKDDMPVISAVIWNRLLNNMKLEIDATIQYARGNRGEGWWALISSSDIKNTDSKYNTYKYSGLPPHPIANPGIDAISATLYPSKTDCLYYIHDTNKQIHCAKTYEEHLINIEKYLK